jgi:hypothetical protein
MKDLKRQIKTNDYTIGSHSYFKSDRERKNRKNIRIFDDTVGSPILSTTPYRSVP